MGERRPGLVVTRFSREAFPLKCQKCVGNCWSMHDLYLMVLDLTKWILLKFRHGQQINHGYNSFLLFDSTHTADKSQKTGTINF